MLLIETATWQMNSIHVEASSCNGDFWQYQVQQLERLKTAKELRRSKQWTKQIDKNLIVVTRLE